MLSQDKSAHDDFRRVHHDYRRRHYDCLVMFKMLLMFFAIFPVRSAVANETAAGGEEGDNAG